jgi:predicted acyltransferase
MRLLSLDVFRGITVAFMIIVNNPGDWGNLYWPLEHAAWHGCTPTDLVFPFFLFIVGVAIPFADKANLADNKVVKYRKTVIRGMKLFGLGLFLSLFPRYNIETVRIMGVLQRIALVYIICSFLFLNLSNKYLIICLKVCLLGYYFLMNFVPVPDFGPANLEPATNLGAWIDRTILTEPHLWKTAKTWDPEGILGTFSAIGNGIIGVLAGKCLLRYDFSGYEKAKWLFFSGIVIAVLGAFWHLAGFPINKSLWTSSYTLFTSGLGLILLSILYYLIDYKGFKSFTSFFVVFGVNSILAFFLSGLIPRILGMFKIDNPSAEPISVSKWMFLSCIKPFFSDPKITSLVGAFTFLIILYIPFYWMWKNKFYVKV